MLVAIIRASVYDLKSWNPHVVYSCVEIWRDLSLYTIEVVNKKDRMTKLNISWMILLSWKENIESSSQDGLVKGYISILLTRWEKNYNFMCTCCLVKSDKGLVHQRVDKATSILRIMS